MREIMVKKIRKAIKNTDFDYYGIRIDTQKYSVGEIANNSHQLFQDPEFDEDDNLIYPKGEGNYEDYYDAGELCGTCCIGFDADDDEDILEAFDRFSIYLGLGKYITIIAGDEGFEGTDEGEIIIEDAKVIAVFEK